MNTVFQSNISGVPDFARMSFNLNDVKIETHPKDARKVTHVEINQQSFEPTSRFMNSVFSRYGFGANFFSYFTPKEVLERIQKVRTDVDLEVTLEVRPEKSPRLLATNAPDEKDIDIKRLFTLGSNLDAKVEYADGKAWFRMVPDSGARTFNIGGDDFRNRFVMECPIDGWGKTRNYLELLRLICENGAIGYSTAFASAVNPGKDMMASLERALTGFDNPDGFIKLRNRFESAQKSAISLFEYNKFQTLLTNLSPDEDEVAEILTSLQSFAGAPSRKYGIVNPEALPEKKQKVLPMDGTMYDLVNLASELGTHVYSGTQAGKMQAWIGETLASEFDMEGVPPQKTSGEFKAFHFVKALRASDMVLTVN